MREVQRNRHKHKPDLAALEALWVANYRGLLTLLPQLPACVGTDIALDVPGRGPVRARLMERGPYTSFLNIEDDLGGAGRGPRFQLRVYHDARLAEVIAFQGHRYFKPHYDYPNQRMYQPDEKFQVNQLFHQWLQTQLASASLWHRAGEPLGQPQP